MNGVFAGELLPRGGIDWPVIIPEMRIYLVKGPCFCGGRNHSPTISKKYSVTVL